MARKTRNYVNNADLLVELQKCKKGKYITNELGRMFQLIAKNYSHKPWFRRYHNDLDDMVSEASISCIKAINKFNKELNKEKPNPFSYFTSVIMNSFFQYLKKKYKNDNFKREMMRDYYHEQGIPFKDLVGESLEENKKNKDKLEKYKNRKNNNSTEEEFLEEM